MSHKYIFGLRGEEIVHISDVDKGLNCNVICPLCKSKLVAKKGSKNKHHFTHHNNDECRGGIETSLHLAAKDILSKSKEFRIPEVYLNFPESYKKSELISENRKIPIDNVYLEKKFDDIIPDLIIESKGKKLCVEIFVTHKVDNIKLNKIKKLDISMIEINLSEWIEDQDLETLTHLLIEETENKKWIYNKLENDIYQKFYNLAQPFNHTHYLNAHECPLNNSFYKGINSIRWVDCIYCEYCFSAKGSRNCLGYARVSQIADLNKTVEERINDWKLREKEKKLREKQLEQKRLLEKKRLQFEQQQKEEAYRQNLIKKGYCPQCLRGGLINGRGNFKDYKTCFNFPRCSYKVKISH
ncbi:topoisomerase DNA-binding C4 zinc finger domain-containing protein [Turicibacter sanguinis]|uniref:topoisomerase DNA-binding C4 zinc finger domain-containing protein n=3 Tax=Turicibacter sanguinis TaxID=154288 RepID=UPI0012BBCEAE|nr:competence protein CoiA family protein [Turicibacter sanguinis]MCU7191711.1 topoisomerase DNA-binding C4 zinc finger domain-containing protein [Turicibacter sanguinis]MDB8437992.1 competence protein CoiA family protein [Turicibacter sanguinis]MTO23460.1 hypothetical protein [Turicibacter sanguinis]MTO26781.1 hypothetical protein [Turicibacter sanguinis]MTO89598.1 hypothetical protein [Turicibacter sanguinis]